jgi:hypothetical protein
LHLLERPEGLLGCLFLVEFVVKVANQLVVCAFADNRVYGFLHIAAIGVQLKQNSGADYLVDVVTLRQTKCPVNNYFQPAISGLLLPAVL